MSTHLRPRSSHMASFLLVGMAIACTQGATSPASDDAQPATATAAPSTNSASTPTPALTPNVLATVASPRFIGRFDTADANGPRMCWPGSSIVAGFEGTSIKVGLTEVTTCTYGNLGAVDNFIDVTIDGNIRSVIKLSHNVNTYTLASGLANGNHTVRISKRTESDMGTVQFTGFVLDAGAKLLPTPAPPSKRIEFVGDSGTVGYGGDGNVTLADMCSFTPDTEHADISYAIQTGVMLAAEVHDTSFSGKGLYQNRDVVGDPYNTLPVLWSYTLADNHLDFTTWDTNQWVPQAVVAVVSGNDFSASTPTEAAYQAGVLKFFKSLRTAYPDAHIFLMVSPMLRSAGDDNTPGTGPRATGLAYAQAIVTAARATDNKVHYIATTEDLGPLFGCDQHMTHATHRQQAAVIAQAIGTTLGWSVDTLATGP